MEFTELMKKTMQQLNKDLKYDVDKVPEKEQTTMYLNLLKLNNK